MKILVYSQMKSEKEKVGWHKTGRNISYFANGIRKNESSNKSLYTLTFIIDFEYSKDTVLMAYSYPYTYSDLNDLLTRIEINEKISDFCVRKTLCRTIAGNRCEYLTITSKDNESETIRKKCVVISARVHPGETVGSWMMHGVIEFLTDLTNPEAKLLRDNFVFKIIPMLNPDGVINGNYRCSLSGCDLNRQWKTPDNVIHPTIYYTKKMILDIQAERGIVFFCDLHGHSKKNDIFMYGCNDPFDPTKTRIFPLILSKICPIFSFEKSRYEVLMIRFGVQKSKERTSRITLWRELKIPNVYTMEASFHGCEKENFINFTCLHYMQMGKELCRSLICCFELKSNIPMSNFDYPSSSQTSKSTFDSRFSKKILFIYYNK